MVFSCHGPLLAMFPCLAVALLFLPGSEADLTSINSFFSGQQFGGSNHAGPCPGSNGCEFNLPEDMSESLRNIDVPVKISRFPVYIDKNMKIGNIVKNGYAKFTNVLCENIHVPDLAVSHSQLARGQSVDVVTPNKGDVDRFAANARSANLRLTWYVRLIVVFKRNAWCSSAKWPSACGACSEKTK
jgi:hypothetical protein